MSLARAIVRKPSVLLLDEPLSHLDASEREQTRRELKHLQRETGYTTVLVTHDQHEALSLADRIAVMDGGLFKQIGTPDEVYDAPANLFVADFVGEPRMNLLEGVLLPNADGRGRFTSPTKRGWRCRRSPPKPSTASAKSPSASGRRICASVSQMKTMRCRRLSSPMSRYRKSGV